MWSHSMGEVPKEATWCSIGGMGRKGLLTRMDLQAEFWSCTEFIGKRDRRSIWWETIKIKWRVPCEWIK